jgi:hypothetical protein
MASSKYGDVKQKTLNRDVPERECQKPAGRHSSINIPTRNAYQIRTNQALSILCINKTVARYFDTTKEKWLLPPLKNRYNA